MLLAKIICDRMQPVQIKIGSIVEIITCTFQLLLQWSRLLTLVTSRTWPECVSSSLAFSFFKFFSTFLYSVTSGYHTIRLVLFKFMVKKRNYTQTLHIFKLVTDLRWKVLFHWYKASEKHSSTAHDDGLLSIASPYMLLASKILCSSSQYLLLFTCCISSHHLSNLTSVVPVL